MSKLFLAMLIGAAVMLAMTDDSKSGLRDTVRSAALTVAEAAQK
jgi:pyrroline-5-carboxylate reductase